MARIVFVCNSGLHMCECVACLNFNFEPPHHIIIRFLYVLKNQPLSDSRIWWGCFDFFTLSSPEKTAAHSTHSTVQMIVRNRNVTHSFYSKTEYENSPICHVLCWYLCVCCKWNRTCSYTYKLYSIAMHVCMRICSFVHVHSFVYVITLESILKVFNDV